MFVSFPADVKSPPMYGSPSTNWIALTPGYVSGSGVAVKSRPFPTGETVDPFSLPMKLAPMLLNEPPKYKLLPFHRSAYTFPPPFPETGALHWQAAHFRTRGIGPVPQLALPVNTLPEGSISTAYSLSPEMPPSESKLPNAGSQNPFTVVGSGV